MAKGIIKIAVVGVGNCFSSLYQGFEYYKDAHQDHIPGIMFANFIEWLLPEQHQSGGRI